ncbi:glycosyltransferase [Puia sp. P3]|uniref:glycosyltransferase n=1 Tax=Puia sp. P3 TaxID=3423952 RepID=UPI003D663FCE
MGRRLSPPSPYYRGEDIVYHPEMQTMGQLVEQRYGGYIKQGLLVLHGKIRPDQISESLRDAHVILVPSIVDNLPYVVMETMNLGKIVLASRQGASAK